MTDARIIVVHTCVHCDDAEVEVVGSPFGPICDRCGRFDGVGSRIRRDLPA